MSVAKNVPYVLQARYQTVEVQDSQEVPYALHCGDTIHISNVKIAHLIVLNVVMCLLSHFA